jgi:CheY-like chemotaxis protein
MGSKILSEAGYTVVAVSNGAAAVKKIAAERPDLLILDVFMPGYSGLEVCERIKNASETAQVPVLLTVTNMEPYSAADGNRVKADGVLIKPFEATDLLAVMHKFEEQLQSAAEIADAQKIETEPEFDEAEAAAIKEMEVRRAELPQEMATSPALGIEHLEETPATEAPSYQAASFFAVEAPAVEEAAPPFGAQPMAESAPVSEVPVTEAASGFEMPPVAEEMRPLDTLPPALPSWDANPPAETAFEPVVEPTPELTAEGEPAAEIAPPVEVEFNSEAPAGEIEAAPPAEFEPTAQAVSEIAVLKEPALATRPEDFAEFATRFGGEHAEDIPIGIAMEDAAAAEALEAIPELLDEPVDLPEEPSASVPEEAMRRAAEHFQVRDEAVDQEPEPEPEPEYDERRIHADFDEPEQEIRHVPAMVEAPELVTHDVSVMVQEQEHQPEQEVQQVTTMLEESEALAQIASGAVIVEQAEQDTQPVSVAVEEPAQELRQSSAMVEEPEPDAQEIPVMVEQAEAAPAELEAPVADTFEIPPVLVTRFAQEMERVQTEAVETASSEPEMEPPAEAAQAPAMSLNEDRVADAVHRVLDRYKGELIAAIVKELKN